MVKSVLLSFKCQTSFESSVSFEYFLCVKYLMIPVSLFCCFVYNVLVLQWACVLVPTVTVLCTDVLWLAFPNYACVVA